MKDKIKNFVPYMLLLCFLIFSVVINYEIQGITCNDEVQLRLNGQRGILYFLKRQILYEDIFQGRILGAIGNFKFISFVSDNIYIFRTIQIIVLLVAFALFGTVVSKLCDSKKSGLLGFSLALAFLPVTFEHAVPNAFVIVVCQPLILLLLSILMYLKYLENIRTKYNVFSCIFLLWGCFLYEFVVTYVLVFPIICLVINYKKYNKIEIWSCFKKSMWHIITSIIYIVLYILQGVIFPTGYSGTTIQLSNFAKIVNVLKVEFLSAIPGYYLVNKKYKYLNSIYRINDQAMVSLFIILVFTASFGVVILYSIMKKKEKRKFNIVSFIGVMMVSIYTFLPTLPNAITTLYQESVSENYFTSIPVSLFLYLAMILLIIIVINFVIERVHLLFIPITIALVCLGANIQYTNRGIAEEQYANYQRFVSIENLLKSSFWTNYGNITIEAPSLYETRNNLAVENEHWSSFISQYGSTKIQICSQSQDAQGYIQMQTDNSFYINIGDSEFYVTQGIPDDTIVVKNKENMNRVVVVEELMFQENNLNFYKINKYQQ